MADERKKQKAFWLPSDDYEAEAELELSIGPVDATEAFGVSWHLPEMRGARGTSVDSEGWEERRMRRGYRPSWELKFGDE